MAESLLSVAQLYVGETVEGENIQRFTGYGDGADLELLPRDTEELSLIVSRVNEIYRRVSGVQGNDVPVEVAPPPPRDTMTPLEWEDVTIARDKYADIRNQLEQRDALDDYLREATETKPEALLIGPVALAEEVE